MELKADVMELSGKVTNLDERVHMLEFSDPDFDESGAVGERLSEPFNTNRALHHPATASPRHHGTVTPPRHCHATTIHSRLAVSPTAICHLEMTAGT